MPTLTQIQNFVILAQELHFTRAANKLHLPQPVLSKEIQKLEEGIGCKLFDRSCKRNITLTEAGKAYFRNIRNVPGKIAESALAAQRASCGKTGELSLAMSSYVYETLNASKALREFLTRYPEVKLKASGTATCFRAHASVVQGETDVGAFYRPENMELNEELEYLTLAESEMMLAMSPDHPLAAKKTVRFSDLKEYGFVLPPAEVRNWFLGGFERSCWDVNHRSVNVIQEVSGGRMSYVLAAAGIGIAILAKGSEEANGGNEVVMRPMEKRIPIYLTLAWRQNNQTPTLKNFVEVMQTLNRAN